MSTKMDQVKRQKHPCPASRGQAGGDLGSSFEFHHRCTTDTFSRSASPSWAHCADHPAAVLAGHLGEAMFKLSVSSSLHQQHLLTLPASFWANRADQPAAVLAGHLGEDMFVYREPHWGACLTACTDVLAGTEAGNCASSDGALLLDNRDVIRLAGHP
jgi:hypothetical protein